MKTNVEPLPVKVGNTQLIEAVDNTEGTIGHIYKVLKNGRHYFVPNNDLRGFGSVTLFTIYHRLKALDEE